MSNPTFDLTQSKKRCTRFRKRILEISQQVAAAHVAPAFSCVEIVDAVYFLLMRRNDDGSSPDTFMMSKGHGCLAQYVALEEIGVLSPKDIASYCKRDGILGCHPDYGNPGICASTGSLGHGMGMAVGMAYADKLKKHDGIIYAVMSDGEFQEGSTWESMMVAPSLGINNLIVFLDLNGYLSLAKIADDMPNFYPVTDKIRAFGWEVHEVDGHKTEDIYRAVGSLSGKKPSVIVAKTVKGKGVSFMENVPIWHYRSPTSAEYQRALEELEQQ